MRVKEIYNAAIQQLKAAEIPDSEIEASSLLGYLLKMTRPQLILAADQTVSSADQKSFQEMMRRRLRREPTAYILGEKEFWSLPFHISKDVLIPRPETEFLVATILEVTGRDEENVRGPVLDLGTGSGVIAVTLALEMSPVKVVAVDYSFAALALASENAARHGVGDRICFINSDWYGAITGNNSFDLIVSNPPYIEHRLLVESGKGCKHPAMQDEVVGFEPHLALDGGAEGLDSIIHIAAGLDRILKNGGWFFMEIGCDQAEPVRRLFDSIAGFDEIQIHKDYSGLPRVLQARKLRKSKYG